MNKIKACLIILTMSVFVNCSLNEHANAQGPGPSWPYTRTITLSPSTPSATFPVKVTLIAGQYAHMNSNGSDLRFYDNSNVNCEYWLEIWTTSGTSTIWVEVATSGSSSLTMYYGNPSAAAVSSGANTFDFFDDFPGSSLDGSWATSGSGSKSVANSQVTISSPSVGNDIYISHAFTPSSTSFLLEARHHESAYHRNRFYAAISSLGLSPTGFDIGYFSDGVPQIFWAGWTTVGVTANTEYLSQWLITDGSTYNWYQYNYTSGALFDSRGTTVASNIRYITFGATEGGSTTIIDWVRVRKYAASPPVATVGAQQPISVCGFSNNTFSSITYTPCINMATNQQTAATIAAHQYFVMNVIQGITYIVKTCSSPTLANALRLAVYNESTGDLITYSTSNTGNTCGNANDAYLTFTSTYSGQIRVLLNNPDDCALTTPSGIAILTDITGGSNTLDDKTATGNDSWIGHIYDGTNSGVAYNGTFSNYLGYYSLIESFNETFGGGGNDIACFGPVNSNGTQRATVLTVTFSIRYRMSSTRHGLLVTGLGSDDGGRLAVDGNLIYNNWADQAYTVHSNVLMSLTGTSTLAYDFYENGGGNQVSYQGIVTVLANALTTNTTQNFCIGSGGSAISGDVYGTLPTGITLSGTGYQWTYSTTPGGTRINLTGATGATFTPTAAAPFNVAGTFYVRRNAILSSANNVSPNPYVATNESNAATITVNPLTVGGSVTGGASVCTGTNSTLLTLGGNNGDVQRWQSSPNGSSWTDFTNTASTYTATNLTATTWYRAVVKSGACAEANSGSTIVTVNPLPAYSLVSTNVSCKDGNDGTIQVTVTIGTSPYQFSNDNGNTWVPGSPTTSPYIFTGLVANTPYPIRVQDSNGCISSQIP